VGAAERFGAQAQIRPIETFHVLVSPPGDALMAMLKVFIDDSGDSTDPNHQDLVLTVAGYISDIDRWKRFEWLWKDVLDGYDVPYLHMKEWWNRNGAIYRNIKGWPEREAHFFGDLIQTIKDTMLCAVSSSIRLKDLRAFNEREGLALDAVAFGLYTCILEIQTKFPNDDIQIVIDKTNKAQKLIGLAVQYAEMDTYDDLRADELSITPIGKEESFKTVLPIQAADFLAWEVRKYGNDRVGWIPPDQGTQQEFNEDYYRWADEKNPRLRMSAVHLSRAVRHIGYVWETFNIDAAHNIRHKHGWG
jgi:Protein of unknown function (DUF3800)